MRRFLSMALVTAVTAMGMPLDAAAAENGTVGLVGTAYKVNMQPLSNADVQIRDLKTGVRINATKSDMNGEFAFRTLQPGTYIVEIIDGNGRLLGMSAPFNLGMGPIVNVSVVAVAHGTAAAGQNAGFSVLGLGPVTSLAVIGAAGAAATTAVVTTRPDASPSR